MQDCFLGVRLKTKKIGTIKGKKIKKFGRNKEEEENTTRKSYHK